MRTAKVLSLTSFQKLYIQDQFNVVHSLNLRDLEVYERVQEINGNWRDRFDCLGERLQDDPETWGPPDRNFIEKDPTKTIWIEAWQEFCLKNKVCTIDCGHSFRKFVHDFQPHRYGYLAPELKYRFSALEGKEGDFNTEVVGDVEALQYWRDSRLTGLRAVYQKPIDELAEKLQTTIKSVLEFFARPQPEDVDYLTRPEPADSRHKSQFEPSHRHCVWLQTKQAKYRPSEPFQRAHYEDISEGTQTTVSCSHWGQSGVGFKSWPYFGEIDNHTGLTKGAPVYYIEGLKKRKRNNRGEDPNKEDDNSYVHGGEEAYTTRGLSQL